MIRAALLLLLSTIALFADEQATYLVLRFSPEMAPRSGEVLSRTGVERVENPDLRSDEVLVRTTDAQVTELQNEPGILLIYPASPELIKGVPTLPCGDLWIAPDSQVGEYVLVGGGWTNGKKGPVHLTYTLGQISAKLGRDREMQVIQRALAEWSKYVQVDFTYSDKSDVPRNLNFVFASGNHGDAFPFDGPGKVLAHTFYPAGVNQEPIAGDLHFDADENWHTAVDPDFFAVVLHELGHALGLGHSTQPSAVMYPYYRKLDGLQQDDIAAIRSLYATRDLNPPTTPTTSTPTPSTTDKTAPSISISSPGTTVYSTSAATIRITGTASDNLGVTEVSWTSSGGRAGVATGTTNWSIPEFALRMGDNPIVVRAKDKAGNTAWRSLTITRR